MVKVDPGGGCLEAAECTIGNESGKLSPYHGSIRRAPPHQQAAIARLREPFDTACNGDYHHRPTIDGQAMDVVATGIVDVAKPIMQLFLAITVP